jgi:agmatinase
MDQHRPQEPAYAGMPTFEKLPLVLDPAELADVDVAIVGAPMDDLASNRPGTRFGPRAIRLAFEGGGEPARWHLDLGVDPFDALQVVDHGDAAVVPGDAHTSHRAIRTSVEQIRAAGTIPIVLGGDHSIAYPNIKAVAESLPHGSVAVVQFDAHADTATDIWGVKWSHGSPFRHLVDDGVLPGNRLVQVGLRGYWPFPEEFEWARSQGVRWHRMEEFEEAGVAGVLERVLTEIEGVDHLFLSVDVDALDPAFAPGTGTPESGGMTSRELLRFVRGLALARDLCGMEVVEVSPPYDHGEITAFVAHSVVLEVLAAVALRRSGGVPSPEDPGPRRT